MMIRTTLASLSAGGVFIHLGWGLPLWGRPDLAQLVCITDILALRAFLVPSTTRRTAFIGALASSMLMVSTWFMYQGRKVHPDAPDAAGYVAVAGCLALGTIILTALTSKTIFGLRERVREAVRLGQYLLLELVSL